MVTVRLGEAERERLPSERLLFLRLKVIPSWGDLIPKFMGGFNGF
jgi:hypothetical protein